MAWGTKWEHVECPVLTFMLIRRTLWHSVINGWKAWKQEKLMVKSKNFLGLPFGVQNFGNTLAAESPL